MATPIRTTGASGCFAWIERLTAAATGPPDELDACLGSIPVDELGAWLDRAVEQLRTVGGNEARQVVLDGLDLLRRSSVLRRIERKDVSAWSSRLLGAIDAAHFTVGSLLQQRASRYGSRALFRTGDGAAGAAVSFRQAALRAERIARGLLALDAEPAPVAILAENRIETALTDLACLAHGLVDVMVPANATEAHVAYILRHARVRTLVVSGAAQLAKAPARREELPELRHVVTFDALPARPAGALTLEELLAGAERASVAATARRAASVRSDDLATVMYTSGTTGAPKGIRFTQRNLVFKRFARGLALPEIGESDVLLCFLPLYHTFGRFLEMLGSVYWGATYCFLDNPSLDALVRGMQRFRPTVFISVPKKWTQLHEAIALRADPLQAADAELAEATRAVTGGRLRFGLSAAGHLDSDVFRFFQRQGIELMSGFGMTEATGGITMTPPGEYREGSLGLALPGIELRLAEDGELCVRGPYVMAGYLDPPGGEPSFDAQGWLHTGDLMQRDADGHYRLVDRKKEIYKNVKGETIAPQRIESLFRDFESVARVFLVGDHHEYNTLLIWPNYGYRELDLRALDPQELKAHFRSLVVSVNKFLSPFERIVDFAILPRDLDAARGELTDKGTPRRKQVVESFRDTIRLLYRRTSLQVGGLELTLPNWLLQALGLTAQDILVSGERVVLPHESRELCVAAIEPGLSRVGTMLYRHPPGPLNLGALLRSPRLWLGNEELFEFAPLDAAQRQRPGRNEEGLQWAGRVGPYAAREDDLERIEEALGRTHRELGDVHLAAVLLAGTDASRALAAIRLLETLVAEKDHVFAEPARLVLSRGAQASEAAVARRAFTVLVPAAKPERFAELVPCFLERWPDLLDEPTRAELGKQYLPPAKIDAFQALAEQACLAGDAQRAGALLCLLAAYGSAHPASFRRLRTFLARMATFGADETIRARAESSGVTLREGFHRWLGPGAGMAVDPETEQEYHWEDVVVFDEQVPDEDRARMLEAVRDTPMIRESSFLFGNGVMIRLDDIPPGGVWIRPLGERHGKAVYRVTIQTRFHGGLDMALNLNRSLSAGEVAEEIRWLMLASGGGGREPLCEDFGGYWRRQDLWTEEFVSGETLDRALRRLSKREGQDERLRQLWPFVAWTGLSAYVDFWHRTGERFEVADPDPSNVIVPTDDYHTGVRIISVSARRPHRGLGALMRELMQHFIRQAVEQYPALAGLAGWDVVFSSVLEILGEGPGLERLERVAAAPEAGGDPAMLEALRAFVEQIRLRGFLPRRLHFAVERYRRWAELSADATPQARARTLHELYETYGLGRLNRDYPESRLRFFRETVFRDGAPALVQGLDGLIEKMRRRELGGEELIDAVAELRRSPHVAEDADYFLARVSLPHLRPEDAADFVSSELCGRSQSEIVVTLEDQDGRPFRVRHALNPKEVGRLLRLCQAARLDVRFRPEHRYLVAMNEREQIVGGIYYEVEEDGSSAHLEKIVVAEAYRRKGVADGLMHELLNRLRSAGIKAVTTGFFRPGYFYKFGFRIEKRYAGLVKSLD